MSLKPHTAEGRRVARHHKQSHAGLLAKLGIDVYMRTGSVRKPNGFLPLWSRRECDILDVLHAARAAYRAAVKRLHPDAGGSTKEMAAMNLTWASVRKMFARRGYSLNA